MKPAIIVVDMLQDNFRDEHHLPITSNARAIIPGINDLLKEARRRGFPVIFSCDSFLPNDFIFQGKMKPHSLRGTPGAEVVKDLIQEPTDILVPKRRFSAFFKTDLDMTLRGLQVDTVAVAGIVTHICVLATAMDALCNDLKTIILEDCCAAPTPEIHQRTLDNYRRNPLYPLMRIMTAEEFMKEW